MKLTLEDDTNQRNDWQFRASGGITDAGEDDVDGNEATGAVGAGADTIEFRGVPLDFQADRPWDLTITLDLGHQTIETIPTFLNALEVEVKSEGAHYWITHSVPDGGIVKGGTADREDSVLDRTLVSGNIREGGFDSYRIWPFAGWDIAADHDLYARLRHPDTDWQLIPGYIPEMRF